MSKQTPCFWCCIVLVVPYIIGCTPSALDKSSALDDAATESAVSDQNRATEISAPSIPEPLALAEKDTEVLFLDATNQVTVPASEAGPATIEPEIQLPPKTPAPPEPAIEQPQLTPDRLAKALASVTALLSVSDAEWASASDLIVEKVVSAMLQAEANTEIALSLNASNAVLFDAMDRDSEVQLEDYLSGRRLSMDLGGFRDANFARLQLETAVKKLGPRTAPSLFNAGKAEFVEKVFGPSSVPFIANAARDGRNKNQAACWLYCRRTYPFAEIGAPPIERLRAIANDISNKNRRGAIFELVNQKENPVKIADALYALTSPGKEDDVLSHEEILDCLLRLSPIDPAIDRMIINKASGNFGKAGTSDAIVRLAMRGNKDAAALIENTLSRPETEFHRGLYERDREHTDKVKSIRVAMANAVGAMGDDGQVYLPSLISLFKTFDPKSDSDERLRSTVADTIGQLGSGGRRFIVDSVNNGDLKLIGAMLKWEAKNLPPEEMFFKWNRVKRESLAQSILKLQTSSGYSNDYAVIDNLESFRGFFYLLERRPPKSKDFQEELLQQLKDCRYLKQRNLTLRIEDFRSGLVDVIGNCDLDAIRGAVSILAKMYAEEPPVEAEVFQHKSKLLQLIASLPSGADPVVPFLQKQLTSEEAFSFKFTVDMLGKIAAGNEGQREHIVDFTLSNLTKIGSGNEDAERVQLCVRSLKDSKSKSNKLVTLAQRALTSVNSLESDKEIEFKVDCCECLASSSDPQVALPFIEKLIAMENLQPQQLYRLLQLSNRLGASPSSSAVSIVIEKMRTSNATMFEFQWILACVTELSAEQSAPLIPELLDAMAVDSETTLHHASMKTLAKIAPNDQRVIDAIALLSLQSNPVSREAAKNALRDMQMEQRTNSLSIE